jgi:archaeosine synthase beta-subunit
MYPAARDARDGFILERRSARPPHDSWRFQNLIVEGELTGERIVASTATVFLTGKECAWRCVMCDLWRFTTTSDTPRGAIPAQIAAARNALSERDQAVTQMKLYNASNFFDPHAVPEDDYQPIAAAMKGLDRVVVESHPALVGPRVDRLLEALREHDGERPVALEVAMGLETANPDALERMNKGLTCEQFADAARALRKRNVDLRVFLLISPPFIPSADQDRWLLASIDRAIECGAGVISLIPTRTGNGAMETLESVGLFRPPHLADIERSMELALTEARPDVGSKRARVFVDLWDLQQFSQCDHCFTARKARLQAINLEQRAPDPIACNRCGHGVAK